MKSEVVQYSLVRFQPDTTRQEVVNVGTVVFAEKGPRLTMATNLGKLTSLDPNLDLARVYARGSQLQAVLNALWGIGATVEEITCRCSVGTGLTLSPTGMVRVDGVGNLELVVEELQRDFVAVPVRRRATQSRVSRLHTEMRTLFKQAGMLGKDPSDIDKHKVVPSFPIDPEVGLFAEFALRNGRLHVTETVDFRTATTTIKSQEAQAKTLLLLQAREHLGETGLHRYVVVTGVDSRVQASLNLLGRHTEDLIVRESSEDWLRYVTAMSRAAQLASIGPTALN